MDSNYIVSRLKSTVYKFPTAKVLRTRLLNLDETERQKVMSGLKIELWKESNNDIYEPLFEIMQRGKRAA